MTGAWMPVVMMWMSASKAVVNCGPWSRMRYLNRSVCSARSISALRAICVVHCAVGCVVAPRMWMRRVACSIMVRTWAVVPSSRSRVKKSVARIASACERRKLALLQGELAQARARVEKLEEIQAQLEAKIQTLCAVITEFSHQGQEEPILAFPSRPETPVPGSGCAGTPRRQINSSTTASPA